LEFLEFEGGQKERLAQFVRGLLLTSQTAPAMG
jgi:hypothetical protein